MARFPSKCELICSGVAMVLSQILFGIAWAMHAIDYDAYAVDSDEGVIELHEVLSSEEHRNEIRIACSCIWLAFPLMIISLYGIKKFTLAIFVGSSAEMAIYLLEKSYIVFITVSTIIIPALSLVGTAYEWSFDEYTADADQVPTGYYIQLYVLTFELELIDCVAVADATFMISMFILPRFILLGSSSRKSHKFVKFRQVMEPRLCQKLGAMTKCCYEIVGVCFVTVLLVIFGIVLFEFAESGFFSIAGQAKFLVAWSFILKFLIGIRLVNIGMSAKHEKLRKIFGEDNDEDDGQKNILSDQQNLNDNYKMDTIQNSNDNVDDAEL